MIRWLALLLAILTCAACLGTRGLRSDECDITVWYVEDLAHGNPRQAGEIQLVDGSEAMTELARLLTGSVQGGTAMPPRLLASRQQRWPALQALFRSGLAVVVTTGPHRGLVAPRKDLATTEQSMVTGLIDAENHDRRILDGLMISTARLEGSQIARFRETVATVRLTLDQAAGATPWSGGTGP